MFLPERYSHGIFATWGWGGGAHPHKTKKPSEAKTCLMSEIFKIISLIRDTLLIDNSCLSFVFWESKYDKKFAFVEFGITKNNLASIILQSTN